ncbi:MAG: carboxysome shell carbonic anhydrase [Thiobacillus sp.]|nr:carboxysome shell carbonic anhydrase [Thiobacillus sp.]
MDTRKRRERLHQAAHAAPVGMAIRPQPAAAPAALPNWPQRHSFCAPGMQPGAGGECVSQQCRPRAHPLTNVVENQRLVEYERSVRARFDAIVPTLKTIAGLQHEADFEARSQRIARERLGFELPAHVLADAWVTALDMRALYGYSVLQAFHEWARAVNADLVGHASDAEYALRFFIECGFHTVDISPCADGRLKGLLQYVLRLPQQAVRRKSYAGAMFDVEANVTQWSETELRRFREGVPTLADASTQYLKIAVYHFSSSDPHHEGCAAHGSDDRQAAEAALGRLLAFRTAIENGFCCGASVATLLIGVDTDNDAIRVHVPDAQGDMMLDCLVDNMSLHQATADLAPDDARRRVAQAIDAAARECARSAPQPGMRRFIERLLTNNLSQIDYVCTHHNGRYADIGHAERFISIGDSFEEVQLRNLVYFGHMHTVEEGAADLDVGISIFSRLNVSHGLPVPVAIHYRYDENVPGARERSVARCRRIKAAIEQRFPKLCQEGLLYCGMTVQANHAGSALEPVDAAPAAAHGH